MECTDEFKYGKGTLEELRAGSVERYDFDRQEVRAIFDMENLEGRLVITPWAVGVYQAHIHKPDSYDKIEEMERTDGFRKMFLGLRSSIINMGIKAITGKEDGIHEELIHVIYDPNVFTNERVLREYLRDDVGRVGLSSCKSIPNFDDKCFYDLIKNGTETISKLESQKVSLEEGKPVLDKLQKEIEGQRDSYGLTQIEYAFLATLKFIDNGSQGKIIIPGDLPPFLRDLS